MKKLRAYVTNANGQKYYFRRHYKASVTCTVRFVTENKVFNILKTIELSN